MNLREWFNKVSSNNNLLYGKLFVAIILFILSIAGLIYFSLKYNIPQDPYFAPFLIVFLIFFLFGFRLLQKMLNNIKSSSVNFAKAPERAVQKPVTAMTDEMDHMVQSFETLKAEFKTKMLHLEKITSEIQTLKELSDISYMTLNADYLLFIVLERALKLANADIGSVMILSRPRKDAFVIKASIGLSDHGKKGTITPFEDSVAKYTVINKTPLLVEDIENDSRFGRQSRGRYSTKSFICMPLKTSNEVIGVMTISRRRSDLIFTQADVDLLVPLLSNAAYIYDNINLFQDMKAMSHSLASLRIICKTINSSLKGQEMIQVIFEQMRKNISFDAILLLSLYVGNPSILNLIDFKSYISTNLSRGKTITYEGTVLEEAINEQRNLFVPDIKELPSLIDIKLFEQKEVQSALIMPLEVEGQVTNLLLIFNISERDWNRQNDILDIMGNYLSLAMEKDRMIESLAKRDHVLESLSLVYSTLRLPTFDLNTTLTQAMAMIQTIMPVEAGYLLLPENDELTFAAAFHLDMRKLQTVRLLKCESIAGYVFEKGESIIINNAQQHPLFSLIVDQETGFNTQTILSAPLIAKGQVIGIIEVLNKTDGIFNEMDEKMLQSIAANVSIALENARLYGNTKSEKRPFLETILKELPHVSVKTG